ncbi:PaaI family thioesterase [Alkalicoccobacillus porphyridii]|uniref:PaaI family thioesterase n=2 Tax=Alkalicoccobacillus porphyridii TaxID=2597270 RepID=A0A553ZX80_9BACI|nr:PaaI family thioesterase [Alkalicoccobacillus porphyridii]
MAEKAERTFWGYVGCEVVDVSNQSVEVKLKVEPHHLNLAGILHGGVHATLLDSAMGLHAMIMYPEAKIVTTNLNIHYVAPVEEDVIVRTQIVHQTQTVITTEGKLMNSKNELCALATASFRKA